MSTSRSAVSLWNRLEVLAAPRTRQVIGVVTFAILTALSAKIALPVPGTAVPFTFQPMVVLLGGALLGARLGSASAVLYLTSGAVGLPVFALPGAGLAYLLGPTGGYLLAYPVAAFVAGSIVGGSNLRNAIGFLLGFGVIYAGGVSWLTILNGWSAALMLGLVPFVLADLVKVVLAVAITARTREKANAIFGV
jgi:biotin transport system substrate-specific component